VQAQVSRVIMDRLRGEEWLGKIMQGLSEYGAQNCDYGGVVVRMLWVPHIDLSCQWSCRECCLLTAHSCYFLQWIELGWAEATFLGNLFSSSPPGVQRLTDTWAQRTASLASKWDWLYGCFFCSRTHYRIKFPTQITFFLKNKCFVLQSLKIF
jgi:hypothetical protein